MREEAHAYVNHGRWVADCPRRDCANAEALAAKDTVFHCSFCKLIAPLVWPANADEIWEVLERRPVPSTRNWFFEGSELAAKLRQPAGQTVAQLLEENYEHGVM